MAFWGKLLKTGISAAMGGFAEQGGARAASFGIDKIMGIPNPQPKTGAALGNDMRAYQDAAFPGTNPWERLGGSGYPGGAVEAAKQSGKVQKEMQSKELATRVQVANIGAQAHVQSAATQLGPRAVTASKDTQMGFRTAQYKTPAQSQIKLLNQQKLNEVKKTILTGNEARIKGAQADVAKMIAKYSVTAEKHKSLLASIENTLRESDPISATSIGLAKAGGVILGATAIGKFMRGVRFMLPTFGKKTLGKFKTKLPPAARRPQMNPQKRPKPAPKRPPLGPLSRRAMP